MYFYSKYSLQRNRVECSTHWKPHNVQTKGWQRDCGSTAKELDSNLNFSPVHISRDSLNTKIKNKIFYTEIDLSDIKNICVSDKNFRINTSINFFKYEPISDYPFSSRDLSFSIKSHDSYNEIQELLLNYKHKFIKEIFIFDFYNSKQNDEIKIGFRFIFQSKTATIKENQVNEIINNIIESALSISSVEIPGLRN